MHAVIHHKDRELDKLEHHHEGTSHHKHDHHKDIVMVYSDELEDKIDAVSDRLRDAYGELPNMRMYAIKHLEWDEEVRKKYPIDMSGIAEESCETEIISQKYDFIEEIIEECLGRPYFPGDYGSCVFPDLCHRRLAEGLYGGRP